MVVVKICMWPKGRRDAERVLCVGALDCVGKIARCPPAAVVRVLPFLNPQHGGPPAPRRRDTHRTHPDRLPA